VFVDIDGALQPDGQWSPLAIALCTRFEGAAVEVSQSGCGLHIIGTAWPLPAHGTRNTPLKLELYSQKRFVALTGDGAMGSVSHDVNGALALTIAEYFRPGVTVTKGEWTHEPVTEWGGPTDDAELVSKARAAAARSAAGAFGGKATFEDLWTGNVPHDGRSEADQSLANHLAFWTGKDCERIERLMRASALARDKWDAPGHADYLTNTILNACAYVTTVATGPRDHAATAPGGGSDWPEADLFVLQGPQIPAPSFPVAILGAYWAEWCAVAARGANAPVDYTAASLLTVAATLIGNARVIAASPNWHEPPILWTMLVGVPSAGKSPALDPLVKIIERFESRMLEEFEQKSRRHDGEFELAKQHRESWERTVKDAAKLGAPAPDLPLCAVEPQPPPRPRVSLSDTTLEAAAEIAAGNPKGLLLYRDELAGWWRGFNRYGGDGERQFWLQAYGARSYTVDRKKAGRPVTVPRLAISVVGGAQPDVLGSMVEGEADGFAARFLYAFPDPVLGFELASVAVDHDGASAALARLHDLTQVDDGQGPPRPFICKLSTDAAPMFEGWWRDRRTAATAASGLWGGWLGKQGGQVLRLALVLEHLWWCVPANSANSAGGSPFEISVDALRAAIELTDSWAGPMARRAFGWAAASPEEADAASLARWIARHGQREFNARTVRRTAGGPGGRLSNAQHMKAACGALTDAGLLRPIGARADGKAGRARDDYAVNPILLALSALPAAKGDA
jgi:hypothetical protein